jgi:hypothetical protein
LSDFRRRNARRLQGAAFRRRKSDKLLGRVIQGEHFVLDGRQFCSRPCLEKQLPRCQICRRPLERSVVIDGRTFCPEHAAGPRCWRCQLPFARGVELPDERHVCENCNRGLIYTNQDAREAYLIALHEVRRITGFQPQPPPELSVIPLDQLTKMSTVEPAIGMQQRGLYRREAVVTRRTNVLGRTRTTTDSVTENIYILSGLDRRQFIATAAHELTHALLAEKYPHFGGQVPTWAEEGICQYVAATVCLLNGYYDELKAIEEATDEEYGDGYRYFKRRFGDSRWPAVSRWLQETEPNQLPAQAPK